MTRPGSTRWQPDTADNYEVGVKGTLDNRVRYSADIFDIQWHNVQEGAQLTPLVLPGAINVGDAYSRASNRDVRESHRSSRTQVDYTYDQTKLTSCSSLRSPACRCPRRPWAPLPGTPKSSVALGARIRPYRRRRRRAALRVDAHYQSSSFRRCRRPFRPSPATPCWTRDALHALALGWRRLRRQPDEQSRHQLVLGPRDLRQSRYQAVVSRPRTVGLDARLFVQGTVKLRVILQRDEQRRDPRPADRLSHRQPRLEPGLIDFVREFLAARGVQSRLYADAGRPQGQSLCEHRSGGPRAACFCPGTPTSCRWMASAGIRTLPVAGDAAPRCSRAARPT